MKQILRCPQNDETDASASFNRLTTLHNTLTTTINLLPCAWPRAIVEALWEFEGGTWLAFSSRFPEVSDLGEKDFLDVVFICVGSSGPGAATFTRPVV